MGKELGKNLMILGITALIAKEVGTLALTHGARREAGKRDNWECQGLDEEGCSLAFLNANQPLNFQSGFMVELAHYPDRHHLSGKGFHDSNPDNARVLCRWDHAVEEVLRDNYKGARMILAGGIYHRNHLKETGQAQAHYSLEDVETFLELNQERFRALVSHLLPAPHG